MRIAVGILASSLLFLPLAAPSHHSPSMFGGNELTLTGTVREFQWSNPHSYIQLIVMQEDGSEHEWSLEMGANVYLYNLGWQPSTVKPGDTITVTILPLRNGERGGLLIDATTANGERLGGRA